nr:hypothetical protein B0A51_03272 [Rachicladosporium sp. CCFEE 5018]
MSDSRDWVWSPRLNTYYRRTGPNDIVTRDGVRLPLSAIAEPRIIPEPRDVPDTVTSRPIPNTSSKVVPVGAGPSRSGGSRLSTSPKYTTDKASNVTNMMDQMTLSAPRSGPNAVIHRGVDYESRVQSAIQKEPKEDITLPDLYSTGIRAHGKLIAINSKTDEEYLDSGKTAGAAWSGNDFDIDTIAYRVRKQPSRFFVLGKIFLVLWAEPAGANSRVTTLPTGGVVPGRHKERIFTKVRRFVVIRAGDRSCSALPILTYDHQGAKKKSLDASENGIVFTGKAVPADAPQVPGLLEYPIRVNADDPTDKLDSESLIHYGKVYTIEHNIKVKPFGNVHDNYIQTLQLQFRDVWVNRMELPRPNPTPASIPRSANSQSGRASNLAPSGQGSDVVQSRQPRQLTDRQRAALEQHGAVADRVRRNTSNAGSRSIRPSDRGSGAGSEAAESSTTGSRRGAAALYLRLRTALLAQGCDEEEADRRARQGVARSLQAESQRAPGEQQREDDREVDSDAGGESDEDGRSGSAPSAGSPQSSQLSAMEIAIEALMARGYTREQARRVVAEAAARRSQSTGRGKERQT